MVDLQTNAKTFKIQDMSTKKTINITCFVCLLSFIVFHINCFFNLFKKEVFALIPEINP